MPIMHIVPLLHRGGYSETGTLAGAAWLRAARFTVWHSLASRVVLSVSAVAMHAQFRARHDAILGAILAVGGGWGR